MKTILMFCCFMSSSAIIFGGEGRYTMKPTEAIRKQFQKAGFGDIENKSRFAERFGGKECQKDGLNFAIATIVNNVNAEGTKPIFRSEIQQLVFLECCVR